MADKRKKISVSDEEEYMREMRSQFKESETAMVDIIDAAQDDLKVLEGEGQWDKDVLDFRKKRGLVTITENLLPAFIDQVEGDFRQNRPMIDVVAVDDMADPETARILAGMIRNIDSQSRSDMIYSESFNQVISSSFGAWRIHTQYEDPMSFNKEIVTLPIENHFALRWDMTCKQFDTSDKKWATVSMVMTKPAYEKKYGKDHQMSSQIPKGDEYQGWFLDTGYRISEYWKVTEKDVDIVLINTGDVVYKSEANDFLAKLRAENKGQIFRVEDERKTQVPVVTSCICSGVEILEGPFEWPGQYIPIVIAFGKRMNLNGKLKIKGLIRDAKQSNKMHNGLISAMTQAVIMQQNAPYVGTTEQFKGKQKEWLEAQNGNIPFVTYNPDDRAPGAPQRQQPAMSAQGFADLLMFNTKTRMDIIGIHEAGLGMRSNEQSGKAILARQQEGDIGTFVFHDNFRHALAFDGRIKIDLIPKIYDTARMQRILGVDGKEEFVQLYEKGIDPETGKDIIKANLKVGKYDVVITTGPSFNTQREQQANGMMQLIQASGPNSPATAIMLPGVIRAQGWKDAQKISEALISMLPANIQSILNDKGTHEGDPQAQAIQAQVQQQVQQMQQQMQQAMQQMQQQIAEKDQELVQLRAGTQAKLADIEARKEMHAIDKQIERERIMAEMTTKENLMKEETNRIIEQAKAKMTTELVMWKEKVAMEEKLARSGAGTPIKESVSV